jgi:hypothetical protein
VYNAFHQLTESETKMKTTVNNPVAKHARSGGGRHKAKFGKQVSRARSKHLGSAY